MLPLTYYIPNIPVAMPELKALIYNISKAYASECKSIPKVGLQRKI